MYASAGMAMDPFLLAQTTNDIICNGDKKKVFYSLGLTCVQDLPDVVVLATLLSLSQ